MQSALITNQHAFQFPSVWSNNQRTFSHFALTHLVPETKSLNQGEKSTLSTSHLIHQAQIQALHPNSKEQAMEVPFRAVFTADLPESWRKAPDPEIQRARARMMGIPPEQMVRRIVFCVPEHPLFIEYEKFLQSVAVP